MEECSRETQYRVELELCLMDNWKQIREFSCYRDCPICLGPMEKSYVFQSPCNHFVCSGCVMNLYAMYKTIACPTCRTDGFKQVTFSENTLYETDTFSEGAHYLNYD